MKEPVFTPINCCVCGTEMGRKPGVQVVLMAVCTNAICQYQGQAPFQTQRDSLISLLVARGKAVSALAAGLNMSRQRVYQIVEQERAGI